MQITLERLKLMSPEQRAQLYENARRLIDKGGQAIMDLIDGSGLPLRSGGMSLSDPAYLRMEEIAWSAEGKTSMVQANASGLPALAGVEPYFVTALGSLYHPHNQGTMSAGSIVGEVMRHLGYEKDGSANMPEGSVAKTAATWKSRASNNLVDQKS